MSSSGNDEPTILGGREKGGQIGRKSMTPKDTKLHEDLPSGSLLTWMSGQLRMSPQAMLYQEHVMNGGNNREKKRSAQTHGAGNPHPAYGMDLQQEDEKNRADLRKRICLPEDARAEVA